MDFFDVNDVKRLILNTKGSLDRPLPNSFEERSKLYDESHNFLINVGEAKNFLEEDPTVKERYDPKYTLKELDEIKSRLRTRLDVLTNLLISEKLKSFFARDLPFQTLEEAEKLSAELKEKFHLWGYQTQPKGRILIIEKFVFLSNTVHYNFDNLNEETYGLLVKFFTHLMGSHDSLPFKVDKQYLEAPTKAFKEKYRDLAMKEERTRAKIIEFLNDKRVNDICRSLPTIEVDFKIPNGNGEVVCNCCYSPDEVMAFIISVLEPKVFYWLSYWEGKTENGEMEFLTFEKTLSSSSCIVVDKTSKAESKSIADDCIILLTILLKKCFKCSEKCTHKHHPSVYRCIADLFNACGMKGKENWNSEKIEKKYGRIKKVSSFNEEWWQKYYKNKLALYANHHKETGLCELIQRYRQTNR